ncbi:MAG: hypothetical protein KY461_00040 [Actinobacteria bacterium]|nr:hypothetical protein [Actinomycetota bacterium]
MATTILALALASAGCFPVARQAEVEVVMEDAVEVEVEVEVPMEPLPPDAGPPPDLEDVTPTPGMADVRPVPWDASTIDGTNVTVAWWSGVAPCNVLDRVEVDEGDEVVTITLFEGSDPAEPDAACIDIAQRKRTTVELSEPVGRRSLVDGADPAS